MWKNGVLSRPGGELWHMSASRGRGKTPTSTVRRQSAALLGMCFPVRAFWRRCCSPGTIATGKSPPPVLRNGGGARRWYLGDLYRAHRAREPAPRCPSIWCPISSSLATTSSGPRARIASRSAATPRDSARIPGRPSWWAGIGPSPVSTAVLAGRPRRCKGRCPMRKIPLRTPPKITAIGSSTPTPKTSGKPPAS